MSSVLSGGRKRRRQGFAPHRVWLAMATLVGSIATAVLLVRH